MKCQGSITLAENPSPALFELLTDVAAQLDQQYFSCLLSSVDGLVYLDYDFDDSGLLEDLQLDEADAKCWVWQALARVLLERLHAHHIGTDQDLDRTAGADFGE